jgi:hypothetical protein
MNSGEIMDAGTLASRLNECCRVQAGRIAGEKKAIPSDLSVRFQALSINVRNPCEFQSPKSKGFRRVRFFRISATTLKFQI